MHILLCSFKYNNNNVWQFYKMVINVNLIYWYDIEIWSLLTSWHHGNLILQCSDSIKLFPAPSFSICHPWLHLLLKQVLKKETIFDVWSMYTWNLLHSAAVAISMAQPCIGLAECTITHVWKSVNSQHPQHHSTADSWCTRWSASPDRNTWILRDPCFWT